MLVRQAAPADRIRVIRMLKDAHTAAGFGTGANPFQYPFQAAYADRAFRSHLDSLDATCLVLDNGGFVGGVLMARVVDYELGPVRVAKETVWWIDPDQRGLAGDDMLAAYEAWATGRGATVIGMAALEVAPRAGALYRRRGYAPVETNFLKAAA